MQSKPKATMSNKTLIIAEAGVNHNGDLTLAKKLIDKAVDAGVDYVKFQTFKAENIVSKKAEKSKYQTKNTGSDESQFNMIKKLELDKEKHLILIDYCKSKGIKFLSTAFDLNSIDLLLELGIRLFKIPSGEITNLPYLEKIGSLGYPIILSTGMSTLEEIRSALNVLRRSGAHLEDITVLHCNTEYPTPMTDVNLNAMLTIGQEFSVKIGYSDHTLGIEVPIAAVALGAVCIEKHFTLDRNLPGPDHKASLEPNELIEMVKCVRNIEKALGSGVKKPSASEKKNILIARKSIHTSKSLAQGHNLTYEDLVMKRPGTGISPMLIESILGKTILVAMQEEHQISISELE